MRAIILAILALVMIAAPVASQSPEPSSTPAPVVDANPLSTWREFKTEVDTYSAYVVEWNTELEAVTAQDQYKLLWGDLLARSLEHLATLALIKPDECYRDYAETYIDYALWINQYVSGVYLVVTAPEIEPPSTESADVILLFAQINAAGSGNKLGEVTCDDAAVPSTPTPTA